MMLRDFLDSLKAYGTAWKIIRMRRLWIYLIIPGLLSIAFGILVAVLANVVSGNISELVESRYPWEAGSAVVTWVSKFLSIILVWAAALMAYKYVILILAAPFMSPLSEKVEAYLLGSPKASIPFDPARMVREIIRGIRLSVRNIVREIVMTLGLLLLGTIPLIGILIAPAIFLVQSYFAGFGNMDYTLERHLGVRQSVHFVRRYKGVATGNGAVFLLLLMIPVVGLFIAPGLATVAGTVESVGRLKTENIIALDEELV